MSGWWAAVAGILLISGVVLGRRRSSLRAALWRPRALWRLRHLERAYRRDGHRQRLFMALSRLMRAAAGELSGDVPVAGLSGRRWLVFLDETGGTDAFTRGAGRWLAEAPYQDEPTLQARDIDVEAVIAACRRWIRHSRFNPEHHR